MLGPNHIPFTVDDMGTLFYKEIASAYYLYQLCTYTVWLWFSYLFVALAMCIVVVGSAIINLYMARTNQVTIMKMTTYVTTCMVRRNGKWSEVNADTLVSGDVIVVKGDGWVLPCDLAIISNACVMDEVNSIL